MVSGISSSNGQTPEQPLKSEEPDNGVVNWSIFLQNDNKISIEEQQQALQEELKANSIVQDAVAKGFNLQYIFDMGGEMLGDVMVRSKELAQLRIDICKNYVMSLVALAEESATKFLSSTQNDSITNVGVGWGKEDSHIQYVLAKLEEKGIDLTNLDEELLTNIISNFDYDIDPDISGIITKDEIDSYNFGAKYMDKDENGNIKDTKVLDWIVNKYIVLSEQNKE